MQPQRPRTRATDNAAAALAVVLISAVLSPPLGAAAGAAWRAFRWAAGW